MLWFSSPPNLLSLQCPRRFCIGHLASGGFASVTSLMVGLRPLWGTKWVRVRPVARHGFASSYGVRYGMDGAWHVAPEGFASTTARALGLQPAFCERGGWHLPRCTQRARTHPVARDTARAVPSHRSRHHDGFASITTLARGSAPLSASPIGAEWPRHRDRGLRGAAMPARRGTRRGKQRKKRRLHPRSQEPTAARLPYGLHPSLTSLSTRAGVRLGTDVSPVPPRRFLPGGRTVRPAHPLPRRQPAPPGTRDGGGRQPLRRLRARVSPPRGLLLRVLVWGVLGVFLHEPAPSPALKHAAPRRFYSPDGEREPRGRCLPCSVAPPSTPGCPGGCRTVLSGARAGRFRLCCIAGCNIAGCRIGARRPLPHAAVTWGLWVASCPPGGS